MDIRQLHYFLVLCEEMNYTRAAQRLFLSRQALRQSISALEAELCGPLFLSAHHKLTLTDRGMSLQRHATPVVEQFQQMQAALRAEIQSAQPVHIGISVALVPDYLPGLETQLDKFRQQYPHVEMRFRLLDNDAVADAVEQGELDAGLVIDLGCAAPVLARTTLRADPACLLVPPRSPLLGPGEHPAGRPAGAAGAAAQPAAGPVQSAVVGLCPGRVCAQRRDRPQLLPGLLSGAGAAVHLPDPLRARCPAGAGPGAGRAAGGPAPAVRIAGTAPGLYSAYIDLLRSYLMEVLGGAASLPPRRGRPAKPFYNFPVLSSTAAKPAAPVHPAPGTQLPFAGATNFRELGGYPADEGKTVRWGQIWRGVCTARLTDPADRARLDALGLRLILDLRSTAEAQAEPDYVPDGARLVQICALCGDDGHEISFAPGDIERMMHTAREGENILYRMYRQMLFGNKAFKELFRALEAGETPILFHCSAGKDRTGVAAMLILLALGASDETICADFVQTNVCRKAEIDALLAGHAEEIAADPSKRMRFFTQAGVDPGAAPYVLQVIREACGSAEEYLAREYGLTPARRMRLRRMYLE